MPASVRQTNFSGGELSPFLWGRTDLPMFSRGLRTCRNFFLSQQGAAVSRPGTKFVNSVTQILPPDYSTGYAPARPVRLIPFVAGDTQAYALELGDLYLKVHQLGRTVQAGGVDYKLVTTYAAADIWTLRIAQVGDVLTIVGPGYPPRELKRTSSIAWALSDIEFARPETRYADVDSPATRTSGFAIVAASYGGIAPSITLTRDAGDSDHPPREWQWVVTSVTKDPQTGALFETLGDLVSEWWDGFGTGVDSEFDDSVHPINSDGKDDNWVLYPDKPITLRRADTLMPGPAPESPIIGYRIYRGRGDVFGLVGVTTSREFVDVGDEPDYSVQPPRGTDPFAAQLAGFSAHLRPRSVAFFQERRVFGGASFVTAKTQISPGVWIGGDDKGLLGRLFLSKTGDYFDYDLRVFGHVSGEALQYEIAARQLERLEHLLELDKLLAFTGSSAWSADGGQGQPIDFDHVDIRRVDAVGSRSSPAPMVVDGSALFVRSKGFGVRALVSRGQDAGFQPFDISQHAEHLFTGKDKQLVDWAYAEDPWGVVWAVRADGALLSLTFSRERQLTGWARHDMKYYGEDGELLDEGFVESVCAIPEGEEDAVYLVVRRKLNVELAAFGISFEGAITVRTIERMTSRVMRVKVDDPDPAYVDQPSAVDTDTLYPTGLCLDSAVTYSGPPTRTFTGLGMFTGKSVFLVGRGLSPLRFTVTDDAMDLEELMDLPAVNAVDGAGVPIFVAHIGLAFTGQLETLDIAHGDARLRKKTVGRVGFEVDNSVGVKAGQDFEHLDEFQVREVGDDYNPVGPATALIDTPVENAWDQSARAVLQQDLPLPLTVVGITRSIDAGD